MSVDPRRAALDDDDRGEDLADVVPLTWPVVAPPAKPAGAVELVTVYAYGGIALKRMIAVVDEHGVVLLSTPVVSTEEELMLTWQRACALMADAFDDEASQYVLRHRRVDERGNDLPGPAAT